ncbi:conserved protein of unknown function [Rhodovastum atsumiense]|nr:hypothetical protein [Rhodovastum atsumiense]CAH2604382.1 conserved protein of unknown function [Rhodovastum atsumiense]
MTLARRTPAGWRVAAPEPVGEVSTLLARLHDPAAAVLLGADLPLGLPRGYAARLRAADFPAFLRGLAASADFFRVCATLAEVGPDRPFYPARGVAGMTRAAHAAALGLPDAAALCRAVDHATAERPAGAPPFWTLGANQSGKAAISAWRDLVMPALSGDALRLWPFEGDLPALLAPGRIVMAETYPAEALRHLGLRLIGSKRRRADRAALAPALLAVLPRLGARPEPALVAAATDGFGADAAGEDRFDCVLGVLCVLNVLAGHRPAFVPDDPWIRHWEGWVLGQTALPRDQSA